MENKLKKLVTQGELSWEEAEPEVRDLHLGELTELRLKVVEGYDKFRNPDIDRGRLSYKTMNNLMLSTTAIDYHINRLGGRV